MGRKKVTVVGGGFVGSTTAQRIVDMELADVVLTDILDGPPAGKALDMMESGPITRTDARATGISTSNGDYSATAGSDVVVITAGFPRKPGMSRDDLLKANYDVAKDGIDAIVERTRKGGAEIVNLLKTGSAYYAPSAAAVEMVDAILKDKKKILPCAVYLDGEYGIKGLFVGVPVKLGAKGVEEIIQIKLTAEENTALQKSAGSVKELVTVLGV